MREKPNVVIVLGRCSSFKKVFGIRLEQMNVRTWNATWSFPIKEVSAKREGYNSNNINGEFLFSEEFLGCPYCELQDMFVCHCGKVACYDPKKNSVFCPWCNSRGHIEGLATSLSGGSDI